MNNIIIEPVRLRHLPALRTCFVAAAHSSFTYLDSFHRQQIISENNLLRLTIAKVQPKRLIFVARRQNKIYGYAIGAIDGNAAYLNWLFVRPEMRGQNVGLKLIAKTAREGSKQGAGKLVLLTFDHQDYYARQGFKPMQSLTSHGAQLDMMGLTIAHHDG